MAVPKRLRVSTAYGIGRLPLPMDNLTSEPVAEIGDSGWYSKTVGDYTLEQGIHVDRLNPVRYCSHPELYLTEAAEFYCMKDLYEDPDAYQIRLQRSYSSFRPYYTHLRNLIVGTALRKEILVPDGISEKWDYFFSNVDLDGHSFQSFAKRVFTNAIDGGCAGILVEYPRVDSEITRGQEKEQGYRPYFLAIPSSDVLGWTSEVTATTLADNTIYGRRLTSLRIKDEHREIDPNDEFNELVYPAVRVFDFDGKDERVRYRLFVARDDDSGSDERYVLDTSSLGYLSINMIPYVPIYGGIRESFMLARPLLLDVARLNLQHWSMTADLCNQLHLSANPKFVVSGVRGGQAEFDNSPDKMLILEDAEAKAEWKGAPMDGAQAIMDFLKSGEEAMEKLAAVAMTVNATNQAESGFSKLLDRAQSDSFLAVLVQGLEESLNLAIGIAAEYWKEEAPEVNLSRDFVPVRLHSQQILAYVELYARGVLSKQLLLQMLETGDVFDGIPDFDIQEELSLTGSEPGETGLDAELELKEASSVNGQKDTTKVVGSRPRQASESGAEVKEASRPSLPGG